MTSQRLSSLEDYFVHFDLPFERNRYKTRRARILQSFRMMLEDANCTLDEDYDACKQMFQKACRNNPSVISLELEGCGKCNDCR